MRALFAAGRPAFAVSALVAGAAVAAAAIAVAAGLGAGPVAVRNPPLPLCALAVLGSGVLLLVTSSRMRQQELRASWRDDEWLRSFNSGLLARLLSPTAADRPARTRRWSLAVVAGAGWPLAVSGFLLPEQNWGALSIPAAVFLALGAAVALGTAWETRPWAKRP